MAEGGAPASTRTTRRQHVERLARTLGAADPWLVEGQQLVAWFDAQPWAQETRRGHRTTYRAFWGWAVEAGHCVASPALALPRVKPAPANPRPASEIAYRFALKAAGRRERLMLRLAAEMGLRRAEVSRVHTRRDLMQDLEGWTLVVHGKGDKIRYVPIPDGIALQLLDLPDGWAFPGNVDGHLSARWVGKLVGRLLPEGTTMHALRHKFATEAYDASGCDLFVVQELLGHASPVTTRAYVAVKKSKLRQTVNAVAA